MTIKGNSKKLILMKIHNDISMALGKMYMLEEDEPTMATERLKEAQGIVYSQIIKLKNEGA